MPSTPRVALLLLSLALAASAASALSPIVIVPCLAGSQIQAKLNKTSVPEPYCALQSDWFGLWLDVKQMLPGPYQCWAANAPLVYDAATDSVGNVPGVQTRIVDFGGTDGFDCLDPNFCIAQGSYTKTLTTALVSAGFVPGATLFGAPYDWRYSGASMPEYLDELTVRLCALTS
jgi:lysophospholipase-3